MGQGRREGQRDLIYKVQTVPDMVEHSFLFSSGSCTNKEEKRIYTSMNMIIPAASIRVTGLFHILIFPSFVSLLLWVCLFVFWSLCVLLPLVDVSIFHSL